MLDHLSPILCLKNPVLILEITDQDCHSSSVEFIIDEELTLLNLPR